MVSFEPFFIPIAISIDGENVIDFSDVNSGVTEETTDSDVNSGVTEETTDSVE